MKSRLTLLSLISILWLACPAYSADTPANSAKPFLGRWDLTLKTPDRDLPSWLELTLDGGTLKAQFVGRWGNARPLPRAEVANDKLTFVSPKEDEGSNH